MAKISLKSDLLMLIRENRKSTFQIICFLLSPRWHFPSPLALDIKFELYYFEYFRHFCKTLKEVFITRPCALKYSRRVLCFPICNEPNPPLANKGGSNRGEESVNHGSVQLLYQ